MDRPLDLDAIEARANAATPGPWHARGLDDESCRNLIGVSTEPDTGLHETIGPRDGAHMVAVTMDHFHACHAAERWDEDAEFIAASRADVPALVAELRRERAAAEATVAAERQRCAALCDAHARDARTDRAEGAARGESLAMLAYEDGRKHAAQDLAAAIRGGDEVPRG